MKNLFKNSFKSFYKNKTALLLTSVLVFLTTTIFTLLTSVGITFKKSYNDVVIEKKLHDFISKEKYDLSGNIGFQKGVYKIPGDKTTWEDLKYDSTNKIVTNYDQSDITTQNINGGGYSTDTNYIYIQNANGISNGKSETLKQGIVSVWLKNNGSNSKQQAENIIIRIKKSDLYFSYNSDVVKNQLISVLPAKSSIKFDILLKKIVDGKKLLIPDLGSKVVGINAFDNETKLNHINHNLKIINNTDEGLKKFSENKSNIWLSSNKLKISNNMTDNQNIVKKSINIDVLIPKQIGAQPKTQSQKFGDWIKEIINKNNDKYLHKSNEKRYWIKPSITKSSGIFKSLLQDTTIGQNNQSTRQKINEFIKINGLDSYLIVGDSQVEKTNTLKIETLKDYILSFAIREKRKNYITKINELYGDKLDHRMNYSVNVSDNIKNYKVVTTSKKDIINELKIYDGYQLPEKMGDKEFLKFGKNLAKEREFKIIEDSSRPDDYKIVKKNSAYVSTITSGATIDKTKKFKWVMRYTKTIIPILGSETVVPQNAVITDPSSNFAIVSPGYYKENNLVAINPKTFLSNKQIKEDLIFNPQKVYDKYPNSIVKVGEATFIVAGSGIQPDYSFPIISGSKPIPNQKNEAILFVNNNGYLKTDDSYRGNEHENYISFKWKDNIKLTKKQKDHILYNSQNKVINGISTPTSIEAISKQMMSWPPNVRIISKGMDTTEQIVFAPHRISFLNKIKNNIELITFLTTTLLVLASGLFITIFLKKHINTNRKQFGILLANGYTKTQISLSNIVFAFLIMTIPSILGYLSGFSLQYYFMNLFGKYWTLPISNQSYSWITFLLYIVLPFIVIVLFTFLISRWELRGQIINIINGSKSQTGNTLLSKALGQLSFIGIKTKISLSLFFTNLSKMIMVFVVSTASIITLSMGFASIGKFEQAKQASAGISNYNFSINLISPTKEGGLIKRNSTTNLGVDFANNTVNEIYSEIQKESVKATVDAPTWMAPNISDSTNSKGINYLKNKLQFQSLLNVSLGSYYGASSNPWVDTGMPIMPEGQRITSDKQRIKFNKYGASLAQNQKYKDKDWFKDIMNINVGVPSPKNVDGTTEIKEEYLKFIIITLKDILDDFENKKQYFPMIISYKSALLNDADETYTYVDANYLKKGINGKEINERINIIGYKKDTKMLNFNSKKHDAITNYEPKNNETPIMINTYFSEMYNLKKGNIFKMQVKNMTDRISGDSIQEKEFAIIDIIESYNGPKAYTTQKVANKLLGLEQLKNTEINWNGEVFNGVFTKNNSPAVLNSIPLYSLSGYYPGTDVINENDSIMSSIVNDINSSQGNNMTAKRYLLKYSKSTYVAAFSNVDWVRVSQYAFDSTLQLSTDIILIIQTTALIFSILFVIIITMLLISDNKKYISTMKVIGYKSSDINKTFFKAILPSFLISVIVSIPLAIGILFGMKIAIINFGQIYIPLSLSWWEISLASISVISISIIVYWISSRELKNQSVLEAFKE